MKGAKISGRKEKPQTGQNKRHPYDNLNRLHPVEVYLNMSY
jgi:hypothetical protein